MLAVLRAGIQTLGETVSGLNADNLSYAKAKHSNVYPFCVFHGIDEEKQWDGGKNYRVTQVQFSIYSDTISEVDSIAESIDNVFDFSTALAASGWTLVPPILPMLETPLRESIPGSGIWQRDLDYRIEIEKAK